MLFSGNHCGPGERQFVLSLTCLFTFAYDALLCFVLIRDKTSHWKVKNIDSKEQRVGGLCPLTPKEVGLFLKALGFPSSTLIYIAAGEIYGGDVHLSELTSRFPNIVFKVS